MKVTREVITDLLPAYYAKEASADSRALVEEFFAQDPEFARLAKEQEDADLFAAPPSAPLRRDQELETLIKTRVSLRLRSLWLALAITFTLFPMSAVFNSKGLVWLMLRDAPQFASTCLAIAVVCWIQFLRTKRRLRSSGV
jgi:hypothetical protein